RGSGECALWRALWFNQDALIGDSLTVLSHPATRLGDSNVPTYRHYCGSDIRRMMMESIAVDPTVEDWSCDGLRCGYNQGSGVRSVFVFRLDRNQEPKLWIM